MIASVLALVSAPAAANATVVQTRISGVDRYATSASVAIKAYPTGTNHVVLVSGESFADGLAASGLAGSVGGPVLLTHPTTLMGSTGNAIGTLDAGVTGKMNVHIIGGTSAVSAAQATTLTGLGYTVTRYSGADRYATAAAVADAMYLKTGFGTNPYNSRKTAFLVTGSAFADGLSVGQIAFIGHHPVLLTNGTSLSAETKAVLDSETYGIKRVHIIGGTSAVSAAVATEIAALKNGLTAIETRRTSGADRYATAVEVGKYKTKLSTLDGYGHTAVTNVVVANGENFADALSAAALAGQATDLLVLSAGSAISSATDTYLKGLSTSIGTQQLVGGVSALSAAAAVSLKAAVVYNKPTATISAVEGSATVTITFSEKMTGGTAPALGTGSTTCGTDAGVAGTGIHTAANFKKNNTAFAAFEANTLNVCKTQDADEVMTSLNALGTVLTVTLPAVAAAGDVLTLVGGANVATASGARQVATTVFTVVNDAVRPTATVDFNLNKNLHSVTFSEAVKDFAAADVSCVGAATAAASTANQVGTSNTWEVNCLDANKPTTTSHTLVVAKAAFTDLGGNTMLVDSTTFPVNDLSAPSITKAEVTLSTPTQGSLAFDVGTGIVTVTAKKAGTLNGVNSVGWKMQYLDGNETAGTYAVLYDIVAKKIVVSSDISSTTAATRPTAAGVSAALNANALFAANWTAVVATVGTAETAFALTAVAGGVTTSTIKVTFSEPVIETCATTDDRFDVSVSGNAAVISTNVQTVVDASSRADLNYVIMTDVADAAAEKITVGTSKIVVATTCTDVAGNANAAAISAVIN